MNKENIKDMLETWASSDRLPGSVTPEQLNNRLYDLARSCIDTEPTSRHEGAWSDGVYRRGSIYENGELRSETDDEMRARVIQTMRTEAKEIDGYKLCLGCGTQLRNLKWNEEPFCGTREECMQTWRIKKETDHSRLQHTEIVMLRATLSHARELAKDLHAKHRAAIKEIECPSNTRHIATLENCFENLYDAIVEAVKS